MVRILLAATFIATVATPALADRLARTPQQITAALKQGCTVQYLHTQTGKNLHATANIYCDDRATAAVAKAAPAPKAEIAAN